jgi:hypothetical protein
MLLEDPGQIGNPFSGTFYPPMVDIVEGLQEK